MVNDLRRYGFGVGVKARGAWAFIENEKPFEGGAGGVIRIIQRS
jgi:hypothetical protein